MEYAINNSMSINETLNKMTSGDILILKKGLYKEKVEVLKDNITIIGESENDTIISNKDFYHKIMNDYNECNTFRTYSMIVVGNNVCLKNITIVNESTPSSKYGQAVALSVLGDNFLADGITLKSAQDTLFTGPIPKNLRIRYNGFLNNYYIKGTPSKQIYKNSKIYGDVDFIFGGATALFYKCDIISIDRKPNDSINGYLTAPSHSEDLKYGYLFYKCNLIQENKDMKTVYLSRPWRDYGTCAFIDNNYCDAINQKGFSNWSGTERDKTTRCYEYSDKVDLKDRAYWAHILTKDESVTYVKDFFSYINYKEED